MRRLRDRRYIQIEDQNEKKVDSNGDRCGFPLRPRRKSGGGWIPNAAMRLRSNWP